MVVKKGQKIPQTRFSVVESLEVIFVTKVVLCVFRSYIQKQAIDISPVL